MDKKEEKEEIKSPFINVTSALARSFAMIKAGKERTKLKRANRLKKKNKRNDLHSQPASLPDDQ